MTPQEPSGSLPSPSSPQPATPLPWFSCPPPVHGDPFKPGLAIEMAKQNEFYALHAANTLPQLEAEINRLKGALYAAQGSLHLDDIPRAQEFINQALEGRRE